MNTRNFEARIKKLENPYGNRIVYIPVIGRFGEGLPPYVLRPGATIKNFTGSLPSDSPRGVDS